MWIYWRNRAATGGTHGRPYRYDSNQLSSNIEFILENFFHESKSTKVDESTNVSSINKEFKLEQNYPNPFNPSTNIKFSLPKPETVTIEIYDIIGQRIETLLSKPMSAGYHEVEFNGQNLSSGIYLYRIEASEWSDVKKMILLR